MGRCDSVNDGVLFFIRAGRLTNRFSRPGHARRSAAFGCFDTFVFTAIRRRHRIRGPSAELSSLGH